MKLGELSRISTVRLLPVYGVLFVLWSVLLIGWVQYDTKRYLSSVVDEILRQRMHYLSHIDRDRLPETMAQTDALDLRGVMLYGLFDEAGKKITGNIERIPEDFSLDGVVHAVPGGVQRIGGGDGDVARNSGSRQRLQAADIGIQYDAVQRRSGQRVCRDVVVGAVGVVDGAGCCRERHV